MIAVVGATGILAGMETYYSAIEMEEIPSTFDVPLTSLDTFVREQTAQTI